MTTLFERFRSILYRNQPGERYRILIAEDHVDLSNIIAMLLEHCGFDVKQAHDGRIVLGLARAFRPHFILLDVKLPGLNGYEVAEQIRGDETFAHTIIIGVSAYSPVPRPGLPLKAHFDHYLTKPFDLETLLGVLNPTSGPSSGVARG
ncbi:response regulator [Tundrisphaera sp. TA3]|uniref:response regulator n=1 Tax=Tundrisphaera sp. TA3 TaxID=3435775 RepID=UPI003EBC3349